MQLPQDPLVGQIIGQRYEIVSQLGAGGMGRIYRAKQVSGSQRMRVDRLVAIKVLNGFAASLPRFQTEAAVLAKLRHPSTVSFFDCGESEDGQPYLVMELLDGESLGERLCRGPLDVKTTLGLLRDVCGSLEEAHSLGIIHRDIKPANIFFARTASEEHVKVLDFGIAKIVGEAQVASGKETTQGLIVGTPAYCSPEQAAARPLTPASDLYSLGVVAYECLSGRPPFAGAGVELLLSHSRQAPPSFAEVAPDTSIDPRISELVMRLLAKDPGARFPSARALRDRIVELQSEIEAAPRPPSSGSPKRRSWAPAALALGVLGFALVAGYLSLSPRRSATPEPPVRKSVLQAAPAGMVRFPRTRFQLGSTSDEIQRAFEWCTSLAGEACRREVYEREQPKSEEDVAPFFLDALEVSHREFAAWLRKEPGLALDGDRLSSSGVFLARLNGEKTGLVWDAESSGVSVRAGWEDRPVTGVTFEAAQRFCAHKGCRLPSEREWELAARGSVGRSFPWGEALPGCAGVAIARAPGMPCEKTTASSSAVGSSQQDETPEGVRDLAGNVAEWTSDRYVERYDQVPAADERRRAVRGGYFDMWPESARGAGRSRWPEDDVAHNIGFRCAKSEEGP